MCTAQPVFQVTVNNQLTYLCGKCIAENSIHYVVEVNHNNIIEQTCQCSICT